MLLRLPLPLEDDALRDLDIECMAPPGIDIEFTIAPGRLDARFAKPSSATITIGARTAFTACARAPDPSPEPLSRADFELYTRPSEGLVRISPRIRALAARLAGDERNAWAALQRYWNFLLDDLTCGVVDYGTLDAARPLDQVLEAGWFDCQLGSALLVALCRTGGIPARIVSGYLLYTASPSYHWWAEVWLADRGWIPLDTICSDLSARGRDAPWRDYFMGQLDYRMKTECLPRLFSRSPGLRLPAAWRMLARADGEATEIGLYDCKTGAPIYRDRIVVRHGAEACRDAADSDGAASRVNANPL
ncbi:MAG: transglutaminase domain-containing protein [Aromatoleum sp.]|nr:transglutaminase domain-containing protein [Aromatoleum sp.]